VRVYGIEQETRVDGANVGNSTLVRIGYILSRQRVRQVLRVLYDATAGASFIY